jgi:diadenosine tetraphosphatase ApaH/serine/threonine PP2A family protein phosphatase
VFKLFEESGPKDSQTFLFLGDYVDRGYYSLETIFYFLALKLRYPGQFYLLRGNHECRQINQLCGFYIECQSRYRDGGVWMLCNELFYLFPIAAIVDHRVFAAHGGLSPDLPVVEKVSLLCRNEELPTSGPLCDLCWSDPDPATTEWRMNMRGAGYLFGDRQAKAFCHLNGDLDFVARSHQLAELGFAWNFDRRVVSAKLHVPLGKQGKRHEIQKGGRQGASDGRIRGNGGGKEKGTRRGAARAVLRLNLRFARFRPASRLPLVAFRARQYIGDIVQPIECRFR